MDNARLIKAKEYYEQVQAGKDKTEVARKLVGISPRRIEASDEYLAVVAAAAQVERAILRRDIERVKRKQIKTYSNLLDKGDEMMKKAQSTKDQLAAQANQRKNLGVGVVDSAVAWDGEDRNKTDFGEIMEGVIL